jgi:hypothetical protein
MSNIYATRYTTADEIAFLQGMLTGKAHVFGNNTVTHGWRGKGANPEGFRRYAQMVLDDMRAYPDTVDVPRVKAWIHTGLADMAAPAAHPAVLVGDGDLDGAE